jgi:hypothetical protein
MIRGRGISGNGRQRQPFGGRWAPAARDGADVPVLYTSLARDGAIAEVVSYLTLLTPLPSRPLKVSRLGVSTAKTMRLARVALEGLGIDMAQYGVRDYRRTQSIGAALAFLGLDGLIAPSARWRCDNLMIYQTNHLLSERLEVIELARSLHEPAVLVLVVGLGIDLTLHNEKLPKRERSEKRGHVLDVCR